MKSIENVGFLVLIGLVTLSAFYFVFLFSDFGQPTGFDSVQRGTGILEFEPTQLPPPPGGGGGGGGYRALFPEKELPCPPARKYHKEGQEVGMLLAGYNPEVMNDLEIVITVIDNNDGDELRAVFVDRSCQKIKEVNLGKEKTNKIFTFIPSEHVSVPAGLYIQSVNKYAVVNNPLLGKMYLRKGIARTASLNMNGARTERSWKQEVEGLDSINFNNHNWKRLPEQTFNTQLFPTAYQLTNVFEPLRETKLYLGYELAEVELGCINAIKIHDVSMPTFVRNQEIGLAVKEYNAGGTNGIEYATKSFNSIYEGPDRFLFKKTVRGSAKDAAGVPDSIPQATFATIGSIEPYNGGILEDWIVITNIGSKSETVQVRYYDGVSCGLDKRELKLLGDQTTIVKVSDITKSKAKATGAIVVESISGKRNLIVEKYGVLNGDQVLYKTNALSPFKTTGMRNMLRDTSRKFMASVPAAKKDETFKIKIINLQALDDHAKIKEKIRIDLTDGLNNWRTFELFRTGCVMEITQDDIKEWAKQSTWYTRPEHLNMFVQFNGPGAIYPTDVITMESPMIIANDPGFMLGETIGNCCSADDCYSRWNLYGYGCGADSTYGDSVCSRDNIRYPQAKVAPPEPAPAPVLQLPVYYPPEPQVVVPYTPYKFPWGYFLIAILFLLGASYWFWRQSGNKRKRH